MRNLTCPILINLGILSFFFPFFSQLPTLFPLGKGPFRFAIMGVGFTITFRLSMGFCLKKERLRRVNPAATTPFAPLDFAPEDEIKEITSSLGTYK